MSELLVIDALRAGYGEAVVLPSMSLTLGEGQVLALLGRNGTGKTTLINSIVGITRCFGGRMALGGTDITALEGRALQPFRRRLQMVFQDSTASLNPRKTVRRVLGESLELAGITAADRATAISELLEQVGLDRSFANRYPHQLSGGQRQRVAIARALAMRPELLVADEPVSSLEIGRAHV